MVGSTALVTLTEKKTAIQMSNRHEDTFTNENGMSVANFMAMTPTRL